MINQEKRLTTIENEYMSFSKDTTINPFEELSLVIHEGSSEGPNHYNIGSSISIVNSSQYNNLTPSMQAALQHILMKFFLTESFNLFMTEKDAKVSTFMDFLFNYILKLDNKKQLN